MIMSIKSKIRRINRKYRQFVNYGMTALIVALLVGVYSYRQEAVYQKNLDMVVADYEMAQTILLQKQDSIMSEVDRLKVGIDESATRRFKITNTANIIKDVQKTYSDSDALKLATILYEECERLDLPLSYVLAVITVESRFNHKVTSNVGAQGIMQIMPSTFMAISRLHGYDYIENDITDLKKNIRIGCVFLHRLISKQNDLTLASAAYNGGPKVAAKYAMMLQGDMSVSVPDETRAYVVNVGKNFKQYKKILGE